MDTPAGDPLRRASLLSVVLPVYNERDVLSALTDRLVTTLQPLGLPFELVFVDDGSRDGSGEVLDLLAARQPAVRVVHLSRNFGHQAAIQAGLMFARGEAIVIMDSDLQDAPEAIPTFLAEWERGWDVVYAIRAQRKEGLWKRALFSLFYRGLRQVADTKLPVDSGNFGLIDRRVRDAITDLGEHDRYYPGLRAWVGFRQKGIVVERQARYDGRPRVGVGGLFRLAATAVFSFSAFPLRFFYIVALASIAKCLFVSVFTLYQNIFTHTASPGWTSDLLSIGFFGAINALGIYVLGEYVIRIYDEVRRRPIFLVQRTVNCDDAAEPES